MFLKLKSILLLVLMLFVFSANASIFNAIFHGTSGGKKALIALMKRVGDFAEEGPAIEAAESFIYMAHVLGKKGLKEYPVVNVKIDDITSPKEIIDMYNDMLNKTSFSSVASLNSYKEANDLKICGRCASKELKKAGFGGVMTTAPEGFWGYMKSANLKSIKSAADKAKYLGKRTVKIGNKKVKMFSRDDLSKFMKGAKNDVLVKLDALRRLRNPGVLAHEKVLAEAISRFGRVGNKTFHSYNKIIYLMTDGLDEDLAYKWAALLKKLSLEDPLDPVTGRTENLKQWFKGEAEGNDKLWKYYKELDERGCLW